MAASAAPRATGKLRPHRRGSEEPRRGRDAARAVGQAGRRLPHARGCAARADRQFQPRAALGDLGPFQRARSQRPHDVRPDDGRLVDLYRHARHRAGHLRDLRRDGPPALRRRPFRPMDPHRRSRRHGRRAAARRDHGRRLLPCGRMPAEPHRVASAHAAMSTASADTLDEALAIIEQSLPATGSRSPSVSSATPPRSFRRLVRRGIRPDAVTDQTSAHDPINGYLPKGWTLGEWESKRESDPKAVEQRCEAVHGRACARHARFPQGGRADPRLRQQHPPDGQGRRRRQRLRLSRLRAGLYPPALLPRHRPVPLGRALGRSGGHLQDRRQGEGAAARQQAPAQLARHGARAHRSSRACRRASAGSGSATAIASASPSTRWWPRAS